MLKATLNLGMAIFDVAARQNRRATAPDALRPSAERRRSKAERKDILAQDRDLTERVKALLDAKDAEARNAGPGPAALAVEESPDIVLFKCLLLMGKGWREAGHHKGDPWTDGQLKSIGLLMNYCMAPTDGIAETFLLEVQEVPFYRSARDQVQKVVRAAERRKARDKQAADYAVEKTRLDDLYASYRATPGANWRDLPDAAQPQVPDSDYQRHLAELGPQPYLWHDMATDLHEMGDDRLAAVYWITEQPECDILTVAAFIGACLYWDALDRWAFYAKGKVTWQIAAFCRLVDRWNQGAFTNSRLSRADAFTHQADRLFVEELEVAGIRRLYARHHERFGMVMPEVPRDLPNAMGLAPPKSLIQLEGPWRYNPNGCKTVPSEQFQP